MSSTAAALKQLGHSLTSPKATTSAAVAVATPPECRSCILTLLRILDNILRDPSCSNPKIRKIKVSNATFWNRAGRWEGSVNFLASVGFVGSGKQQLKLEKEDFETLRKGREELVEFAVNILGMERSTLPACPTTTTTTTIEKNPSGGNPNQQNQQQLQQPSTKELNNNKKKGLTVDTINAGGGTKSIASPDVAVARRRSSPKNTNSGETPHAIKNTAMHFNAMENNTHYSPDKTGKQKTTTPKILSLEQIQNMAQKEREESKLEARRLEEERRGMILAAAASTTTSTAAAVKQVVVEATTTAKQQQRRASRKITSDEQQQHRSSLLAKQQKEEERRNILLEQERRLDDEKQKLILQQQQQRLQQQQRQQLASVIAGARMDQEEVQLSQSQNIIANEHDGGSASKKPAANNMINRGNNNDTVSKDDAAALSDEMTDLLDEIEMELNDSFFDTTPNHDTSRKTDYGDETRHGKNLKNVGNVKNDLFETNNRVTPILLKGDQPRAVAMPLSIMCTSEMLMMAETETASDDIEEAAVVGTDVQPMQLLDTRRSGRVRLEQQTLPINVDSSHEEAAGSSALDNDNDWDKSGTPQEHHDLPTTATIVDAANNASSNNNGINVKEEQQQQAIHLSAMVEELLVQQSSSKPSKQQSQIPEGGGHDVDTDTSCFADIRSSRVTSDEHDNDDDDNEDNSNLNGEYGYNNRSASDLLLDELESESDHNILAAASSASAVADTHIVSHNKSLQQGAENRLLHEKNHMDDNYAEMNTIARMQDESGGDGTKAEYDEADTILLSENKQRILQDEAKIHPPPESSSNKNKLLRSESGATDAAVAAVSYKEEEGEAATFESNNIGESSSLDNDNFEKEPQQHQREDPVQNGDSMNNDDNDILEQVVAPSPSSLLPTPSNYDNDNLGDAYTQLFQSIPLPEGEFATSDDNNNNNSEEVTKFRYGFELCHCALFSIWNDDNNDNYDRVVGTAKRSRSMRSGTLFHGHGNSATDACTTTAGLSNLKRWRQEVVWEENENDMNINEEKPVVLVPLAFVYSAWACILGLKFKDNEDDDDGNDNRSNSNSKGRNNRRTRGSSSSSAAAAGVQAGMMYSWVVSNHRELSTLDDVSVDSSLGSSSISARNPDVEYLPMASVSVCNYVCKALRDIGLITLYEADIHNQRDSTSMLLSSKATTSSSSSSKEEPLFFIGMTKGIFDSCIQKKREGGGDMMMMMMMPSLDGTLLRDCHSTLARAVYPRILHEIARSSSTSDTPTTATTVNDCNIHPQAVDKVVMNFLWYSASYAPRHLLSCHHHNRLADAKSLLSNAAFLRLRLQLLGLLAGTRTHCHDLSMMDTCLSQSLDEWRRKRLRHADDRIKSELSNSSVDEYDEHHRHHQDLSENGDNNNNAQGPPDVAQWKEDHFAILCSISTVLREKAGELSSSLSSPSSSNSQQQQQRNLQKDIGNALQMIGECIGDIGVYRVQEMEHYEEALQMKSEAYGEDQNHESIADILYIKGCHHQRFQHFKFAQKCYEQALRIYKVTLGYEHPCVARVLHNIGIMYHAKNDNGIALKCLKKSLSIRESQLGEMDLSVADSYCWIGKIYREKRDFKKAKECFVTAHKIKVEVLGKAHVESAEVLHNIGIVCDDLGLHSKRQALLIRLANVSGRAYDVDGINDVCDTLDCIANLYRIKGERQKALQFFEQCLKRRVRIVSVGHALSDKNQVSLLLRTYEDVIALTKLQVKECTDKKEMSDKIGTLLVEMGTLYDHRLNKQSKALIYLQKALQVFQQQKDYKQIGNTLSLIGVIHVKKSANQKALKCFRDSLVMRKMSSSDKETLGIADTMHNIGNCEARDGLFEDSLRSYEEALRIKKKIYHPEEEHSISVAKTEHCIGLALLQLGNLDDALESFQSSLKVRRASLGNDHLDVSFSLHSLGKIYFHQNNFDHAITCLEEALEIKKSKLPEKHMSLAETQHLLGSLYIKKSNFTPAIPLLKSALMAYRGSRDCDIMKSDVLDLLGSAYANLGENDNAILSYEHSLKIKKVVIGTESTPSSNVLMEIGKLKSAKGDIDGALVAFKEVKRIQKMIYGKNHLKNADLLISVGLVQDKLNNNDMALRCFVEALRMRRKLLDKNHRDIAEALVHTGRMYQSKNDHFKALGFFQDAIKIYRESDGNEVSQDCANACRLLGLSQIASGDSENALHSLEKCLELRESTYGSESEQWAESAYDLGIAQSEAGLYEDAVVLLDKFVHLQKSFEDSNTEMLSNALLHLGKIHLKKRNPDDAMAHFDEALVIRKQMSDNELGVSEVLFQIGGVRESKKQYLESLVCYEESLKLRLSVSEEDEDTADIVSRIGEVRRIRGQYDLALENFTLALGMYKSTVGETHLSVANTYHSLGYVCDAKNDLQKAMQNHKEGLSVRKLILGGDDVKVAASLDDVAGMYQKQNEHKKALRCLKEALRIRKLQLGNDDIEIGKTLFGMGIIFAAIDDNQKAEECYNASLEISSRVGTHPKLEAQTLHQIGCLHAAKCDYREALQNWRTCLSKYREGGLRDDHYMVACTLGNIEMAENVLNT